MKALSSGFESSSANESIGMLTDDSEFECPLMQRKTQSKSATQIRKKRKVESNDKSKWIVKGVGWKSKLQQWNKDRGY